MIPKCVRHQCGTCGRYVRAGTVTEAPGYCASGWCPQHGRVDVLCGTRTSPAKTTRETTHLIAAGEAVTSCCGRTPFELPRTEGITVDPALRTCGGQT